MGPVSTMASDSIKMAMVLNQILLENDLSINDRHWLGSLLENVKANGDWK